MEARRQLDEIRKAKQQKFIEHTYKSVLDIHNQLIELITSFHYEVVDITKITNNEKYSLQQKYCFEKLNEMRGDDSRDRSRIKSFRKNVNELINVLYDNLKKINAEKKAPDEVVEQFNDKIEKIILALDEFIDCAERNYNIRYELYKKVSEELKELQKIYGNIQKIIHEDIKCENPQKDEERKVTRPWIDFTELHPDIYIKGIAQCKSIDELKQFTAVFYGLNHFSRNFFLPNAKAIATITATGPEVATAINLGEVVYKRVSELLPREKLNSVLDKAIKENNIGAFRLFFSYAAADFNSALTNAATCASLSILRELLNVREDLKIASGEAVVLSVSTKRVLKSALDKAIEETYTKEGAVNNDKVEIFELLLKFDVSHYATALVSAVRNGNLLIVKSLLDRREIFKPEISTFIQRTLNAAIITMGNTEISKASRYHQIFDMLFACENIDYKKLLIVAAKNISPRAVGAILEKCDLLKAQDPNNDLLLTQDIKVALEEAVCSRGRSRRNQKRVIEMLLAREAIDCVEVILSNVDKLKSPASTGYVARGLSVIVAAKGAEIAQQHPEAVSKILPKLIWNGDGLFKAFFDLGTQLAPNFGDSVLGDCLFHPEIFKLVLNGHVSKRYAISRRAIVGVLFSCISRSPENNCHIENFQTLFAFEAKFRKDFQLSKEDYQGLLRDVLFITHPPIEVLTIFLEGLKARHCSLDFNQKTRQSVQNALSDAIRTNNFKVFKLLSDHLPADYDELLTVAKASGFFQVEIENLIIKANQAKESARERKDALSKEKPFTMANGIFSNPGLRMDEAEVEEERARAAVNKKEEVKEEAHEEEGAVAPAPRKKLRLFERFGKSRQKENNTTQHPKNNNSKLSKRT